MYYWKHDQVFKQSSELAPLRSPCLVPVNNHNCHLPFLSLSRSSLCTVGRIEKIPTKTEKKCGHPYLFLFKDSCLSKKEVWGGGASTYLAVLLWTDGEDEISQVLEKLLSRNHLRVCLL